MTIREALDDPALLGSIMPGDSWTAWRTVLIASMGEELTGKERALFQQLTGRPAEPGERIEEAAWIVGRRGGKSRAESATAAYIAGLCDHGDVLAPGERGVLLCIAPDQRQAKIVLDYTEAAFVDSPTLTQLVVTRTQDALELSNRISVEVRAASFRRLRGPTYIAVMADESAFWSTDEGSANADSEILAAVRPGLATTGGPLIVASSPYARKGELFELHRRHYGPEGDPRILVARGASRALNPSLPQSVVDRAMQRDPVAAKAEYLAEFRSDIEGFISLEAVEAVTAEGVIERMPEPGVRYHAFLDPSGGVRDSQVLAIAHLETRDGADVAVLDLIREARAPFVPARVCAEFADVMKHYRCKSAHSDRYAAAWPEQEMKRHGITLRPAEKDRSALYLDLLGPLNSGLVSLLDNRRLRTQLVALERRTGSSGRDVVNHSSRVGAHDDVANACAGAIYHVLKKPKFVRRSGLAGPRLIAA